MSEAGMYNWLSAMIGQFDPATVPLECRLFVNDFTPVVGMTAGDFVEAAFDGYAPVELVWSEWSAPAFTDERQETAFGDSPLEWVNAGSTQTVYGYYFFDPDSEEVWLAEAFATPRTLTTGATLQLELKMYLRNDPDPI